MSAVKVLGIIGGLGLAGVLLWSFYLKSTPLPERTFERGLPAEAKTAKNPVPMKPTDPKKKTKATPTAAPTKAVPAAANAQAGSGGATATAAPAKDAGAAKPTEVKDAKAKPAEPKAADAQPAAPAKK